MNRTASGSNQWAGLRTVATLAVMLVLMKLCQAQDVFSNATKPAVLAVLKLLGVAAVDQGSAFHIGNIEVPWTRDCSGINLVLVIAALAAWLNRGEPVLSRYLTRIALTVPFALCANILRVLTLIGYRTVFYPHVESPQLHYMFGLAWLVPFFGLLLPRDGRPRSHALAEAFHASAVIALMTPLNGTPGGTAAMLAALLCLTQCRYQGALSCMGGVIFGLWLLAGLGIAMVEMESFWLPWLLACPALMPPRWALAFPGGALILLTHPLAGLVPWVTEITYAACAFAAWKWMNAHQPTNAREASALNAAGLLPRFVAAVVFFPFCASAMSRTGGRLELPPAIAKSVEISAETYEVTLPGQPENIGLRWFATSGRARHHTMKVCMKYRGMELVPVAESSQVQTDGQRWLREFFVVNGRLIDTHREYVMRTLGVRAEPGAHLIFVAAKEQMSAQAFDEACRRLVAGGIRPLATR